MDVDRSSLFNCHPDPSTRYKHDHVLTGVSFLPAGLSAVREGLQTARRQWSSNVPTLEAARIATLDLATTLAQRDANTELCNVPFVELSCDPPELPVEVVGSIPT